MDFLKLLKELDNDIKEISELRMIVARLANGGAKRRGRPPKSLAGLAAAINVTPITTPTGRPKRTMSAATRKKMAAAQKKRYAAKRRAAGAESSVA